MPRISKKQRATLREIDKIAAEVKRHRILGAISIAVMVVLILAYNMLVYQFGIISESNIVMRAMLYLTAMVIAGYSGIMLMKASQKQKKIDGYRQSTGISRETLEAWRKGEIE